MSIFWMFKLYYNLALQYEWFLVNNLLKHSAQMPKCKSILIAQIAVWK